MSVSVFIWGMFTWNFAQMFGSFTCLLQKKGSGSTVNKKTMTSFFITTFIDLRHIVLFCLNTWTITLHYLWFDCYLRCCVLHVLRCTSVWAQQHNYNVYCWDSSCQCINSPPPWIQTALVVKRLTASGDMGHLVYMNKTWSSVNHAAGLSLYRAFSQQTFDS